MTTPQDLLCDTADTDVSVIPKNIVSERKERLQNIFFKVLGNISSTLSSNTDVNRLKLVRKQGGDNRKDIETELYCQKKLS